VKKRVKKGSKRGNLGSKEGKFACFEVILGVKIGSFPLKLVDGCFKKPAKSNTFNQPIYVLPTK
jgi:hypothetical protein